MKRGFGIKIAVIVGITLLLIALPLFGSCAKPAEKVVEKPVEKEVIVEKPVPSPKPKPAEVRILSASVGTSNFIGQTLWAYHISSKLGVRSSAFPGGATINLPLLDRGDGDLGMTDSQALYIDWEGIGKKPVRNIAFLFQFSEALANLHVRADSKIYKVDDLWGKKIGMSAKGSTAQQLAKPQMEALGFTEEKVVKAGGVLISASFADMGTGLADGTLDAAWFTNVPSRVHNSLLPVEERWGVRVIPIPDEAIAKVLKGNPSMFDTRLEPGVYKGTKEAVRGIGVITPFIARGDFSAELVYDIMKVIYSDEVVKDYLAATVFEDPRPIEFALKGAKMIPMHPGAARFWKEVRGVDVEARGIKIAK